MAYVDGYILAVKADRIEEYRAVAEKAALVWKEHGALRVVECLADDVPYGELTSFPRAVLATEEEVTIFSWIEYPSREVRDACNARVMADPRMKADMSAMPFDGKRIIFGGFSPLLDR